MKKHFSILFGIFGFLFLISVISTSSYSAVCGVSQNMTFISSYVNTSSLDGANQLVVHDGIAYVSAGALDSLTTLNVSDPQNIRYLDRVTDATNMDGPQGLSYQNGHVFVANYYSNDIMSIDVSDPTNIAIADNRGYTGVYRFDLFTQGDYAYATSFNNDRLSVWDISNPSSVTSNTFLSSGTVQNQMRGLSYRGKLAAYGAEDYVGIIRFTEPDQIRRDESVVQSGTEFEGTRETAMAGEIMYVAAETDTSVTSVNLSDMTNIQIIDNLKDATNLNGLIDMRWAYGVLFLLSENSQQVSVVNISDPANMAFQEHQYFSQLASGSVEGIYIDNDILYATVKNTSHDGIVLINISCYVNEYQLPSSPPGDPKLKQVHYGTYSSSSSALQYMPIGAEVNTSSSILFYTYDTDGSSNSAHYTQTNIGFYNTSHLIFNKTYSGSDEVNVSYYVAEFDSGVETQGTLGTVYQQYSGVYPISPVNSSSSWAWNSVRDGSNSFADDDFMRYFIDDRGAIHWYSDMYYNDDITYQVINYKGAKVQRGSYNATSSEDVISDINITRVDPTKSFLRTDAQIPNWATTRDMGFVLNFTNTTHISFERDSAGSGDTYFYWDLIEFTGNEKVYTGAFEMDSSTLKTTANLPENVNTSASVITISGLKNWGQSDNSASTEGPIAFSTSFLDSNTIQIQRGTHEGDHAIGQWVVIEFDNGIGNNVDLTYVSPTPADSTVQNGSFVVNATVTGDGYSSFVDLNNSLVAWWNFDSNNGTHAYDISGNNYHGTFEGHAQPNITSMIKGRFASFDSVDDWIELPTDSTIISNKQAITVAAWINPRNIPTGSLSEAFVAFGTDEGTTNSRFSFEVRDNDELTISARSYREATPVQINTTSSPLTTGQWHHVVGVVDFNNSEIRIYHNGVLQAGSLAGTFDYPQTNESVSSFSAIGAGESGLFQDFNGSVDDVMVFDRELNESEITYLFNSSNGIAVAYNFTNRTLSDGHHSFRVCSSGPTGNYSCTSSRIVNLTSDVVATPSNPDIVDYAYPTPSANVKYSGTSFTVSYGNGTENIAPCNIVIDSVIYAGTYSNGYCSYTYTFSQDNKTTFTFYGSYNSSNTNLTPRQITYYPSLEVISEVPSFGIGSFLVVIVIVLWGLLG